MWFLFLDLDANVQNILSVFRVYRNPDVTITNEVFFVDWGETRKNEQR